jgi:predicted lactoylglutathione lyase
MRDLTAVEIKAFVPAKDFELSKRFYQDLGFTVAWSSEGLAYIRHGNTSFLLQKFQEKAPDNFMMHLLNPRTFASVHSARSSNARRIADRSAIFFYFAPLTAAAWNPM